MNLLERARGAIEETILRRKLRVAPVEQKEAEPTLPKLVLIESGIIVGNGVDAILHGKLTGLSSDFQRALAQGFLNRGCEVITLADEKDDAPRINTQYMAMVKPVFLGKLPQDAYGLLAVVEPTEYEWDASFQEKREVLKETIPEVSGRPLMGTIGAMLCERMGITPSVHQNYINMVFVDDTEGIIRHLPYQWKRWFNWMLMAKLGSFKAIIVPYSRVDDEVVAHEAMFATLEGGHPRYAKEKLAGVLFPFTMTKKAGDWKWLDWPKMPRDTWRERPSVQRLMALGRFLGEHRLLSPQGRIQDVVKDGRLQRWLELLAQFSRQAEGAFMEYDPESRCFFVTVSGRFGAVKTNLSDLEVIALSPSQRFKGLVWTVPVEGQNPEIGPSVEAEEFTGPLLELLREDAMRYGIRLQSVNGYYRESREGVFAPAIGSVIHLHRFVDTEYLPEEVILVKADIEKYPPVGCGVDKMHEMSKDAMRRAIEEWNAGGRRAKVAVFYVPNHGCNIFLFRAKDENGAIPKDSATFFKELVTSGKLRFTYEVPQVNGDIEESQKSFIAVPVAA